LRVREQSLPRTAVDAPGASLEVDQANAEEDVAFDQIVDVFLSPSQLLAHEVLRRPPEFTQYLSISYTERLAQAGAVTSVGSRGDAYDNALAETINGLYKTEVIKKRGPWKTIEDVEFATLEWVDWFNNRRLLEPIGYIPPTEFEDMYYREQSPVEDEGLKQMSLH